VGVVNVDIQLRVITHPQVDGGFARFIGHVGDASVFDLHDGRLIILSSSLLLLKRPTDIGDSMTVTSN
jgi:hypothetical protein